MITTVRQERDWKDKKLMQYKIILILHPNLKPGLFIH